ncbi:YraN family protein [Bifidobacterium aemilianum]|uniref:UPF0102 protein CRD60_02995 n=1 Tax=Bifidobacterium aemilianum TaxID=2493120 RepID=A0A366K8Z0_9BIFI|nr:YraN family protein [Bifidobacterium aemilianum]RBP98134.1 YraN family protein [Bifidobacterium aemilianum]
MTNTSKTTATVKSPAPQSPADASTQALAGLLTDPSVSSRQLGRLGEQYARSWLEEQGWRILDHNWHSRYGELDLVALDPQGLLVFVEVKTRRSKLYGSPQEAITAHKRLTLRRAGVQWLMDPENHVAHTGSSFDVIAVSVHQGQVHLNHIREAF